MSAECKTLTCCDEDDFPQTSSSEGNCPPGWYWNETSCVRCAIPAAPSLTLSASQIGLNFIVTTDLLYRIERKEAGHWMTLLNGTGAGASTYFDDTVEPGTPYSYRITVAVSEECGYIEGESASATAI